MTSELFARRDTRRMRPLAAGIAIACCITIAVATASAASPAPPPAASTAAQRAAPTIEDAWVRATPSATAPVAGGYLTLRNRSDRADRLLSVTSPDAARVEIHEMRMDGGVMRMRELRNGVEIGPRSSAVLAPGGAHLMFIAPKRRFLAGETVVATLRFERGGTREVRFAVRAHGSGKGQNKATGHDETHRRRH